MIYTEIITINGKEYKRTYSDTYTIERDGVEYYEAVDPVDGERNYTETANPLYPTEGEDISGEELLHMVEEVLGV